MTGDEVPIVREDPHTGECYEFTPGALQAILKPVYETERKKTKHGYACPICAHLIDLCYDAALLADTLLLWAPSPDATQPPIGFEIVD